MMAHKILSVFLVTQGLRPILSGVKYFQATKKRLNLISLETIRVGFPQSVQKPFISGDPETGRLVGYYIDLARNLLNLAGMNSTFTLEPAGSYNTIGNCLGNISFNNLWVSNP